MRWSSDGGAIREEMKKVSTFPGTKEGAEKIDVLS
jgi:hypothetical protein